MRRHSLLRTVFSTVAVLTVVYTVVCVVAGITLAEDSLHLPKSQVEDGVGFRQRVGRDFGAKVKDVEVTGADGALLQAWYVTPPKPNGKAVILLHGITGNRVDPSGFGDIF